jgi:hypothetical protein
MTLKTIHGCENALEPLYREVGTNSFMFFQPDDNLFQSLSGFYPTSYLKKCTSIVVAVSGEANSSTDWLVVCPFRVDEDKDDGRKSYDLDPFVITADRTVGELAPIGIVAYHQRFEGRTTPVDGFEEFTLCETVATLKQRLPSEPTDISQIPLPVRNALDHMASLMRAKGQSGS